MLSWSALLALLPFVSALPLNRRDDLGTRCGSYEKISHDKYSMLTNLWGSADANSGQQCSTLLSVENDIVSWKTSYSWDGGVKVKSYSNVELEVGINLQLGSIVSMPSTWGWSQDNQGDVNSDIAYDFFTSSSPGGNKENEVMIFLGVFGDVNPISYEYNYDGTALAIVSGLSIDDYVWDLYRGSNGYNNVLSFVRTSDNIQDFKGDMYHFFSYLIENGYIESSQYLIVAQGGTEATSGAAEFTTTAYSLAINGD